MTSASPARAGAYPRPPSVKRGKVVGLGRKIGRTMRSAIEDMVYKPLPVNPRHNQERKERGRAGDRNSELYRELRDNHMVRDGTVRTGGKREGDDSYE